MKIQHFPALEQGSEEWLAARCGMLTASEMKLIMTGTGRPAVNDKARAHLWELLAQRVTGYVEPHYISDDMLRGHEDEIEARALYAQHYAPVQAMGFVVRDFGAYRIGCSPDGLVGDDGMIECKSRRQKFQAETIASGAMPDDFAHQVQTALLVTGRAWCDFVSYCGGMPMVTIRVAADAAHQARVIEAAEAFEDQLAEKLAAYRHHARRLRTLPTERRIEQEMML